MGVMDYFKSVPSMTADEVRRFLAEKHPDEYNLVDVRQPGEYEIVAELAVEEARSHFRIELADERKAVEVPSTGSYGN